MRHEITSAPCLRVTVMDYDPLRNKAIPSTKLCHKAIVAAEHYALTRNSFYWRDKDRRTVTFYPTWNARYAKLYRRVLKVFNQYLP